MADQNNSQTVTINDAIVQVKKWAAEKNYEQVKEGCEEILQVEPGNKEIKDLLAEAEKALTPQPAAPAPSPAPAPTPTAAPVPNAQPSPEDIFKKTTESPKTTTVKSADVEQVKGPDKLKEEKAPSEKKGSIAKVITIVVFLAVLGGFIFSFTQGWLNPFYDWILGRIGL